MNHLQSWNYRELYLHYHRTEYLLFEWLVMRQKPHVLFVNFQRYWGLVMDEEEIGELSRGMLLLEGEAIVS